MIQLIRDWLRNRRRRIIMQCLGRRALRTGDETDPECFSRVRRHLEREAGTYLS